MPDEIPWTGAAPATPPAVAWDTGGSVSTLPPVAPPLDDQSWVDVQATYEAVLLSLRLTVADPDAGQILFCVNSAASLIDQFLDRTTPLPSPPPAPVQSALEQLTIELYRRQDAPFNVLNATVPEDVPVDLTGQGALQSVAPILQPWKQRWGFA
jgi:hypothetical protein